MTIRDTLGRDFTLSYDSAGHIVALADYAGRRITYSYDADNNLIEVRGPAALPDFPLGKTTRYEYACGFAELTAGGEPAPTAALNHNLLRVIDGKGQVSLENEYFPTTDPAQINFDRVHTQRLGVAPMGEILRTATMEPLAVRCHPRFSVARDRGRNANTMRRANCVFPQTMSP